MSPGGGLPYCIQAVYLHDAVPVQLSASFARIVACSSCRALRDGVLQSEGHRGTVRARSASLKGAPVSSLNTADSAVAGQDSGVLGHCSKLSWASNLHGQRARRASKAVDFMYRVAVFEE